MLSIFQRDSVNNVKYIRWLTDRTTHSHMPPYRALKCPHVNERAELCFEIAQEVHLPAIHRRRKCRSLFLVRTRNRSPSHLPSEAAEETRASAMKRGVKLNIMKAFWARYMDIIKSYDRRSTNELNGKIAVLVVSCDKYADLWPPFFQLFLRFWPECPFSVYLISNQKGPAYHDVKLYSSVMTFPGQTICWGH